MYFKLYRDIYKILKREGKSFDSRYNKYQFVISKLISKEFNYKQEEIDYLVIKRATNFIFKTKIIKLKNKKKWLWLVRNKKEPYRIIYPFDYYCDKYIKIIKLDFNKINSNFSYKEFKEQFKDVELEPVNAIEFDNRRKIIKVMITDVSEHDYGIEFFTYLGRFVAFDNYSIAYIKFVEELKKRRYTLKHIYPNVINNIYEVYPELII